MRLFSPRLFRKIQAKNKSGIFRIKFWKTFPTFSLGSCQGKFRKKTLQEKHQGIAAVSVNWETNDCASFFCFSAKHYFWGGTMSKLTQQYVLPLFGDFYRRFLGPFQVVNRFGQTSCSCLFSWADVDTPKLWNNSTDSTSSTFHYLGRPMQNAHQVKLLSLCWLVACM